VRGHHKKTFDSAAADPIIALTTIAAELGAGPSLREWAGAHFFYWPTIGRGWNMAPCGCRSDARKICIVSSEKWIAEKVERLVEPAIEAMGFELVRIRLTGDQRRVLQVMAEPHETMTMTVDNCAALSRTIAALLDVEDPIPGEYVLEVSSPGIDRPLVKPRDFERFAGYEIKLEAARVIDGQRRFRGRLKGIVDGYVQLELKSGEAKIAHADIASAKLVLNDDLLAQQKTG